MRASNPGQFEPAEVEVFIERCAEENDVDIGGEDLFIGFEAAGENGAAREDAVDLHGAFGVFLLHVLEAAEHYPVADGGEVRPDCARMPHFSGDFGPDVPRGGVDEICLLVFLDHARSAGGRFARFELGGEAGIPAIGAQVIHAGSLDKTNNSSSFYRGAVGKSDPHHSAGAIARKKYGRAA